MIIELRFKAFNREYFLNPKAVLELDSRQHIPKKVVIGKYLYQKGCVDERMLDLKLFEIQQVVDEYNYHCMRFEYDLPPPKPEKRFNLYLQTTHDSDVSEIVVEFSPILDNIYYN